MAEHNQSVLALRSAIDDLIIDLDQKDRMQRKISFLLDIRGLLIINKMTGQYAEFGVYRGEMLYAAHRILGANLTTYIGLDTFEGLPDPTPEDEKKFVFEKRGFMSAAEYTVSEMVHGAPVKLIKGDFRDPELQEKANRVFNVLSVVVIDSNWPSSNEAALSMALPRLQSGSIIFFDDYYTATQDGNYTRDSIDRIERAGEFKFHFFNTYAPCAVAFIVEKLKK